MIAASLFEPQYTERYSSLATAAARRVLAETVTALGDLADRLVVIGGAAPDLLLPNSAPPHVGTTDIDFGLNVQAMAEGDYGRIVAILRGRGYEPHVALGRFHLSRSVTSPESDQAVTVMVDFLMPREATPSRDLPVQVDGFALQTADGVNLAARHREAITLAVDGVTIRTWVCPMDVLLAMKGALLTERYKLKDAYDIYRCVMNYPDGAEALARCCRRLLTDPVSAVAYGSIARIFDSPDAFGPVCVRRFVEEFGFAGDRTAEDWQQNAFEAVRAFTSALGHEADGLRAGE